MSKASVSTDSKLTSGSQPQSVLAKTESRSRFRLVRQTSEPGSSENFLREVINACASNVAVLDEMGTILYASRSWRYFEETLGVRPTVHDDPPPYFKLLLRCNDRDSGTPSDATSVGDDINRLITGKHKEFHGEYFYHGLTEPHHFTVHAARLNLPGCGTRILITHQDNISPQDALLQNEKRLSRLLETAKIVAWEAEPANWTFSYVSEQAMKLLGYPLAKWYEPGFFLSRIHSDDRNRVWAVCFKQARDLANFDLTFRMTGKDGRVVWVQNVVSVSRQNGKPATVRGFMIDITERKRAQEELRDLSGRLITAQEEERSRVARELHDDLNQRMALLSIELEQLGPEIEKPLALRRRVQKLQEQVHEISADIHRISYRLHPSKLDHLGLAAAIGSLCKEISDGRKLRVEFSQTGFPVEPTKEVTLCLFRIAQESLRNCVKHSGARLARVTLGHTSREIRLSVSDNGCGFDTESGAMQKGLGFTSMRERLRLLEGVIDVQSQPMRGTVIEVSVPLFSETQDWPFRKRILTRSRLQGTKSGVLPR